MFKRKYLKQALLHVCGTRKSDLCLAEKLIIVKEDPTSSEADLGLLQHPRWSAL